MNKHLKTLSVFFLILVFAINIPAADITSLTLSQSQQTPSILNPGTSGFNSAEQTLNELDEEFSDSLVYHTFTNQYFSWNNMSDYYAGFRFTTPAAFQIQGIRYVARESETVENAPVMIYTSTEGEVDSLLNPDELLFEWEGEPTSISTVPNYTPPIAWVEVVFDEVDFLDMEAGTDFWIVIGPCPGEPDWNVAMDADGPYAGNRCKTSYGVNADPTDLFFVTAYDYIINVLGDYSEDYFDVDAFVLFNDVEQFHLASGEEVNFSTKLTNLGTIESPAGDLTFSVLRQTGEEPEEVFSNTVAFDAISALGVDTIDVDATETWTTDEEGHYFAQVWADCGEDENNLDNNLTQLLQDIVSETSWLSYDDGSAETSVTFDPGEGRGIAFYPLSYPASIDSIQFWLGEAYEESDIRVWTIENNTATEVWTSTAAVDTGWNVLAVEDEAFPEGININDGYFVVGVIGFEGFSFHTDANGPTSAANTEMPDVSILYQDAGFYNDITGNWLVRAKLSAGVAPEIVFPETEFTFPETEVGNVSSIEVYVDNNGTGVGHINEIIIAQSVMEVLAVDEALPFELAPGTRDSLTVSWAPDPDDPEDMNNAIVRLMTDDVNEPPNGFMIRFSGTIKDASVRETGEGIPVEYFLAQNYPNPFNPTTDIKFGLKQNGHVNLTIFNLMGQEVGQLVNNELTAGTHIASFDASNLASGIYYYSIEVNGYRDMKKMILIR